MTQPIETVHLDRLIANHTRNMTGRLAVITGTTSGTGYVCAREMAKRGAIVVLLNRESVRSASSMERLQADVPGGEFHAVTCDLQHFGSVRSAIKLIRSNTDRIDVLCNNAVSWRSRMRQPGRLRRTDADQLPLALPAHQGPVRPAAPKRRRTHRQPHVDGADWRTARGQVFQKERWKPWRRWGRPRAGANRRTALGATTRASWPTVRLPTD